MGNRPVVVTSRGGEGRPAPRTFGAGALAPAGVPVFLHVGQVGARAVQRRSQRIRESYPGRIGALTCGYVPRALSQADNCTQLAAG